MIKNLSIFLFIAINALLPFNSTQLKADDLDRLLNEGREYLTDKNYDEALKKFDKVIKKNPESWRAYHNRGLTKQNLKDHIGAILDFSNAIKLNQKQWSVSYWSRGYSKQLISDHKGAISDFTIAINLEPEFYYPYYARAFSKGQTGNYNEAIKDLNLAITKDPNDKYSFSLRGDYKRNIGDLKGSLADYSAAINIDPLYSEIYFSRAWTNFNLGDYEQANVDYEKILDIGDPIQKLDSIIYLMDNNLILSKLSKVPELIEKAKLLLNQADNREKEAALLYAESRYYLFIGNFKKSEELSKKCLAKTNNSIYENACSSLLSNIYIVNEDYEKAKKFIKFRTYEGQLSLAYIAFVEKKLQKAERILKRLYKKQFKIEGFKKPDPYLSSMVGSSLWFQGKNKEAKVFHKESLDTYKSIFGEKNPLLIQPYINLAMVYFNENDFENT